MTSKTNKSKWRLQSTTEGGTVVKFVVAPKFGRGARRQRKERRACRAGARWRFVTLAEDALAAARGTP